MSSDLPAVTKEGNHSSKVRWLPLGIIVIATALALAINLFFPGISFQQRNINSMIIGLVSLILGLVWLAFLSRIARRLRLMLVGGFLLVVLLLAGLFEVKGVTGDLRPIFGLRWGRSKPSAPATEAAFRRSTPPQSSASSNMPLASGSEERLTNNVAASTVPPAQASPEREGESFPQFFGPQRNGEIPGPRLAPDWVSQPPRRLWARPVGAAWSGFAVSRGLAITQEQDGPEELVVAYDLETGEKRWEHRDNARYFTTLAGEGPRATPTIDGDRVFTLGGAGILNSLELRTGHRIWTKNILNDNDAELPEWGTASSPLIWSDLVIVSAGGRENRSLAAYDKSSGERRWAAGSRSAGYSSPHAAEFGGRAQILIFNGGGLFSHDPADGKILWEFPWPGGHPHVALPVLAPTNRVLLSSGYGTGSALLEIRDKPEQLWKTIKLKAKFNNPIYYDGHVYGLDDGILACIDVSNGQQRWKEGRYGHGQLLRIQNQLLLTAEKGEVLLLEATPEEHRVLARAQLLSGKMWNPHALAGERLLVRTAEEAACFEVKRER